MALLVTDPIDLKVDSNGDLVFENGDIAWTSGLEGVVDQIDLALQSVRGEWFMDLDEGMPYFENDTLPASEALMAQVFDEQKALAAFRTGILEVVGVGEILFLAVDFNGASRTLEVEFRVRTVFGDSDLVTTEVVV